MPSPGGRVSSPPPASDVEQQLVFYKSQCDLLEAELADFQTSSRELETELERDVEASEKRERKLQEKVEGLGYEVEEWKVCGFHRHESNLVIDLSQSSLC